MSNELPSNKNTTEEVDLIVFFNLIGNTINKGVNFIVSLFKGLYTLFIKFLKQIFLNIKIIAAVAIIAIIAGHFLDKKTEDIYYSEMIVVPNFDSKYELINNIGYFNSLIQAFDYNELSNQFDITNEESASLVIFEIEKGPQSRNDLIKDYGEFSETLDSVSQKQMDLETFIKNRSLFDSNIFLLRAKSKQSNIFNKLEKGLAKAVNNDTLSKQFKRKKDSTLILDRENLELSLAEVKKIKNTYLRVLENESQKNTFSSNSNSLGLQVEKTQTKEADILAKELKLLERLNNIKKELMVNNVVFEKKSSFKEKGMIEFVWLKKYKIIFPLAALLILGLLNYIFMFYKYVINYK